MALLSKTAALVMLWAKPLYRNGGSGKYVDALDLDSADQLLAACNSICPWYGEVILNRKFLIGEWANEWLSVEGNDQVIILAAGMAPLSMELLENHSDSKIVEVDIDGMSQKKSIFSMLAPDLVHRIEFLDLDVRSEDLMKDIRSRVQWFEPLRPTLFIMEGISYYISEKDLKMIVSGLAIGQQNRLILEYLVPDRDVAEDMRIIPRGIFEAIAEDAALLSFARYSNFDVRSIVQERGGTVLMDASLSHMELLRKGHLDHFVSEGSGWIRCAMIQF